MLGNQRINAIALGALLVFSTILTVAYRPQHSEQADQFIDIDLSTTLNQADFLYGITCDDPSYVYVTLYNQGEVAQIDKSTKAVTAVFNDNAGPIASGQGFYAVERDSSGNLWINERDNGKVWKFTPSTQTWTPIPIVQNLDSPDNPDIDYPEGYTNKPTIVRVNESPGDHGFHTYEFNLPSFGGLKIINGIAYVGLAYNIDFDDQAEANAGVTDVSFAGLAKVNIATNAVSRVAISGAIAPTGLSVDKVDSNILWITDREANKVYKYNISTETVIQTITLPTGSKPRGLDNDNTDLYVALNKPVADPAINSQIMKINKASGAQTVIDTGALNTSGGTFTVFIAANKIIWTDQSQHIGAINQNNVNVKTSFTTTFAESNHFGCLVGNDFWWAGHGSAVVGFMNLDEILPADTQPTPPSDKTFSIDVSGAAESGKKKHKITKDIDIDIDGYYECTETQLKKNKKNIDIDVVGLSSGTVEINGVEKSLLDVSVNINVGKKGTSISYSGTTPTGDTVHGSFTSKAKVKGCDDLDGLSGKGGSLSFTDSGKSYSVKKKLSSRINFT